LQRGLGCKRGGVAWQNLIEANHITAGKNLHSKTPSRQINAALQYNFGLRSRADLPAAGLGYLRVTEPDDNHRKTSMSDAVTPKKPRPEFRNINAFTDLTTYRLPAAGWVSILHRVSGALMFVLLPFIIWMFDKSLSSEFSYAKFTAAFKAGMLGLPGWMWKLVALALIWAYLHHFIAGVRHLIMDGWHKVDKEFGKSSALVTLGLSMLLTAALAGKLFGLY
jgi:succinate dehydrogenase / fumarate reductase cytochrome b subunit